jgi:hypothetical protein
VNDTNISDPLAGGYVLTSSRDGSVRRLSIVTRDAAAGATLEVDGDFRLDHGDCIMDMSVDGDWLMTGGSDARLLVWKLAADERLVRILKGAKFEFSTDFWKIHYFFISKMLAIHSNGIVHAHDGLVTVGRPSFLKLYRRHNQAESDQRVIRVCRKAGAFFDDKSRLANGREHQILIPLQDACAYVYCRKLNVLTSNRRYCIS